MQLPPRPAASNLLETPLSKAIPRCSDECELRARRLAARLGTPEAALLRSMDTRERLQRSRAGRGAAPAAQPARAEPKFAAGREGTPIMLSQVKVRGGLHRRVCRLSWAHSMVRE